MVQFCQWQTLAVGRQVQQFPDSQLPEEACGKGPVWTVEPVDRGGDKAARGALLRVPWAYRQIERSRLLGMHRADLVALYFLVSAPYIAAVTLRLLYARRGLQAFDVAVVCGSNLRSDDPLQRSNGSDPMTRSNGTVCLRLKEASRDSENSGVGFEMCLALAERHTRAIFELTGVHYGSYLLFASLLAADNTTQAVVIDRFLTWPRGPSSKHVEVPKYGLADEALALPATWQRPFILTDVFDPINSSVLMLRLYEQFGNRTADYYAQNLVMPVGRVELMPLRKALLTQAASIVPTYIQFRMPIDSGLFKWPDKCSGEWWMRKCLADPANMAAHGQWEMMCVGGNGSGMFLHRDSHSTASFSAQLVGDKSWVLCGEDQQSLLQRPGSKQPSQRTHYYEIDAFAPDLVQHPGFAYANCSTVALRAGEILYYPEGTFHQTRCSTTPCVSIQSRAVTGHNYRQFQRELQRRCDSPALLPTIYNAEAIGHGGWAPNLSPENCASLPTCTAAWATKFVPA
jgi:hypothetical protein